MTSKDSPAGALPVTDRTRVRRVPARGVFDRATIYAILDEAFVCHVAFAVDSQPYAITTGYARLGDALYLHGSAASRMVRQLSAGLDVCVTVTIVDGLVLARSAFHHSMNYRSVVVFGEATAVRDMAERRAALDRLVDHIVPGRRADARPPSERELRGTLVLALPLDECSVKVRAGGPLDDDEDMDLPVWAGVIPVTTSYGAPVTSDDLTTDAPVPAYASAYRRP